jgi:hypothetical protein
MSLFMCQGAPLQKACILHTDPRKGSVTMTLNCLDALNAWNDQVGQRREE